MTYSVLPFMVGFHGVHTAESAPFGPYRAAGLSFFPNDFTPTSSGESPTGYPCVHQ